MRRLLPALLCAACGLGSPTATSAAVRPIDAHSILVVRGTSSTPNAAERAYAEKVALRVSEWLNAMGIPHQSTTDDGVARHPPSPATRLAILPYNPILPRPTLRALQRFVHNGGRLLVFFSSDPDLASLLRLRLGDYRAASADADWYAIRSSDKAPTHTPARVVQRTPCIREASPGHGAVVAAWWETGSGHLSTDAAWLLSDRGAWMTYLLLPGNVPAKRLMFLAYLAHFEPDAWRLAARTLLPTLGQTGPFPGLPHAVAALAPMIESVRDPRMFQRQLSSLVRAYGGLRDLSRNALYPDCVVAGSDIMDQLARLYALAQHPRTGEFRGVWCHTPTGPFPGDWRRSCRDLRSAGFSDLFVNVAWGGLAHYPSRWLPHSTSLRRYGDLPAQCVDAARREGIRVHLWKVCWKLDGSPPDRVQELRRQHRLQVSDTGQSLNWLCPTHPANVALEVNAAVELADRYEPNGIHLDYIRFPDSRACFCSGCRDRFTADTGRRVARWPDDVLRSPLKEAFQAWRAARISAVVALIRRELHRRYPSLLLSAAVYGSYPECIASVGQDWGHWLRHAWLNFACPMDYMQQPDRFRRLVDRQMALPAAERIFPGIGVTAAESQLSPVETIHQILLAREAGARGFVLFEFNDSLHDQVLPLLPLGPTAPP